MATFQDVYKAAGAPVEISAILEKLSPVRRLPSGMVYAIGTLQDTAGVSQEVFLSPKGGAIPQISDLYTPGKYLVRVYETKDRRTGQKKLGLAGTFLPEQQNFQMPQQKEENSFDPPKARCFALSYAKDILAAESGEPNWNEFWRLVRDFELYLTEGKTPASEQESEQGQDEVEVPF
ncbi:MAG TPA: hypothetical protein PLP49_11570 [Anaerohalosphaeraceae bacterium]|nr:hypothetical protein [Anaerohalosphaeraceae bacterium]HPB94161.1 hypothetical protein [Anaerohalosphaeraceae bacterium]HRT24730.1 hypothetical protein [Anaerohalosphaeraceae bacterium]